MISLVTLFGGRANMLEMYLCSLDGLDYPKNELQLVWVTNSDDAVFRRTLQREFESREADYGSSAMRILDDIPPTQCNFRENYQPAQMDHARVIARMYNEALKASSGEFLFTLEDDVFAPKYSLQCLLPHMNDPNVAVATGMIFSRHQDRALWGWDVRKKSRIITNSAGQPLTLQDYVAQPLRKPWGVCPIGLTTLGVTLIRKEHLNAVGGFKSQHQSSTELVGCDMVMNLDFEIRGLKRIADFNVIGLHFDSQMIPH